MRSTIPKGWRLSARFARELTKIVMACITACFYSFPANYRVTHAQTALPCNQQPILGRNWTWPQNSDVTVNISGAFSTELYGCIRQAFLNWSANPNTAAGVRYSFTHGGTPPTGQNTVYVARTPPPLENGTQPQARVDATFNTANTNLHSALMRVHPDVTNCTAVAEALAHEIGHTYGLDDCHACPPQTSTMTGAGPTMNDTSTGLTSPSNCDAERARQAASYDPTTARGPQPRQETNPGYTGGYNNQPFRGYYGVPNYQCYAAFLMTHYYSCGSSGCTYVYSTSQFMGINCY